MAVIHFSNSLAWKIYVTNQCYLKLTIHLGGHDICFTAMALVVSILGYKVFYKMHGVVGPQTIL